MLRKVKEFPEILRSMWDEGKYVLVIVLALAFIGYCAAWGFADMLGDFPLPVWLTAILMVVVGVWFGAAWDLWSEGMRSSRHAGLLVGFLTVMVLAPFGMGYLAAVTREPWTGWVRWAKYIPSALMFLYVFGGAVVIWAGRKWQKYHSRQSGASPAI